MISKNVQQTIKWLVSIVLPLLLFFIPVNESFTPEIRNFFISTLFIILLWALNLMPYVIPALMLPILYIVIGIAPAQIAFASWSNYIPWMLLAGMILTNIFEEVGLLKRISYWLILRAGGHFNGLLYGLMCSGVIVALILPDIASRTVLFVAIAYGICKALNLEPYSKSATAVMLVGVMTALTPGYIFYTSAAQTLIAWDMAAKSGFEITWFSYLLYNGFPTLVWCFLTVAIIQVMFHSNEVDAVQCRECFRDELNKLGKLSRDEKKLAVLAVALCVFAASTTFHGIAVGWGFVVAVFVCYLPGINLGNEHSSNKVNYGLIIFVASCMAIGTVSNHIGAGKFVANLSQPYLSGGQLHIMSASWLMAVLLNFVMTPLAAVASLSGPLAGIVEQTQTAIVPVLYAWNQGLEHVVVTSVTRDDLPDHGAEQFVRVIKRLTSLGMTVEVLVPDFQGNRSSIARVIEAGPQIINHNVETVPRLYPDVRPQAKYERSLHLLSQVKSLDEGIYTKSGFMLGLGETEEEVVAVLRDLRLVHCDILTIGQYLAPSAQHYPVAEYVHPEVFAKYQDMAYDMGFVHAVAGPLVRSSYHADEFDLQERPGKPITEDNSQEVSKV